MNIQDPCTQPVQAFLTDKLSLGAMIKQVIAHIGAADVAIFSFSVGEEFLRTLRLLKEKGAVKQATLYTDLKAREKTARINLLVEHVFEQIYVGNIHAKGVLFKTEKQRVVLLSSQNLTRGQRLESYTILANDDIYEQLEHQLAAYNFAGISPTARTAGFRPYAASRHGGAAGNSDF